jgi:uncharacterized protein (TIGR00251 family)
MYIKVKVFPESKTNEIIKKSEDSFEIKVKQKPVDGKANSQVIELLSLYLKIPQNKIFLVKGHKERNKIFEIRS